MFDFFAVILVLVGTVLNSVAALFIKRAVFGKPLWVIIFRKMVWGGLFLYGLSAVLYIIALGRAELSSLYPLVSLTFVWTLFSSRGVLGEKITTWKIVGVCGIIIGVVLIGIGS